VSDGVSEEALRAALREIYSKQDADSGRVDALEAKLDQLLEILEGKEVLARGHKRLIEKVGRKGKKDEPRVRLRPLVDKYDVDGPDIDCASLLHLCGARCCAFTVTLTTQDLDEGELRWKYDEPYVLERANDGYCGYIDNRGGCTCYQHRPATCRTYDCRGDSRVWVDWENKVPAPMPPVLLSYEHRKPVDPAGDDD
jgi:hypothetical protein